MRDIFSSIPIQSQNSSSFHACAFSKSTHFRMPFPSNRLIESIFFLLFLSYSVIFCRIAAAQEYGNIQSQIPNVSILVVPTSQNSARISVAYRKEVTKEQLKQDISRLALKGWTVASRIELQNRSIRPDDIAHYPITTSATFSVSAAPQFVNGLPDILTYARAFQQWDHIAALISVPSNRSSAEIQKFDSPAMSVERTQEESLDHYEIIIKDHKGNLPAIIFGTGASGKEIPVAQPSGTGQAKGDIFSKILPFALLIIGACLLTGAGTYLMFSRWMKKTDQNSNQ